jgi:hypothetical protein
VGKAIFEAKFLTIFSFSLKTIYKGILGVKRFTQDLTVWQAAGMEDNMEYDEIMGARLSVLESRISTVEQQMFILMQGSAALQKRRKRDLTPEERAAIRARLVAGQEKARAQREAETKAQAKSARKKEADNEG